MRRQKDYLEAHNDQYVLRVYQDEDPADPRKDWDNFGKMVCWHRRYNLGDEQPRRNPIEWMNGLAGRRLRNHEIDDFESWCEDRYVPDTYNYDKTLDIAIQKGKELFQRWVEKAIEQTVVMLPLRLYDHSGISMSTSHGYPYNDPWDSGQVGWIYATREDIVKEYDDFSKESVEKAIHLMKSEVEVYDQYLRGDVHGFELFEIDHEKLRADDMDFEPDENDDLSEYLIPTDYSCDGFYGSPEESGMAANLPDGARELVKELE